MQAKACPLCHKRNNCEGNHSCWCSNEVFPEGIFELVPAEQLNQSCICMDCLNKFKRGNANSVQ
ncbi:cysteine-rich CWC family protein [Paenibacillus lignilyticus]|uniref:Cysteine-rich CWC family protein n=1 Tax=Paenibacillus lignilyticus TaxID=1172615 RepID=A0ABS5CDD1_9BACL|nr:cysteine-rich CWC family protein [Paenibacillus lignilyticus]MBP3963933.1 cysteine-rich CWC family protein [Paenibacillus lignilyticus]